MPAVEAEEMVALALVFVVHVVGGGMLVWALLDADQRAGWRRNWPRPPWGPPRPPEDEDPPAPPSPSSGAPRRAEPAHTSLPLPVTAASGVRMREPGQVADGYPRPARRPAHEPQPQRAPVPGRQRQRRG
jgi:hypothetical protein